MKAAFQTAIGRIEIQQTPEPKLERPTDVKLRVETVGLCGSDMHYYRTGRVGDQIVRFPWILGHEFAATVVEAGSQAKGVKVGDRVAVDPLMICAQCDQCLAGRRHTCRNQRFTGCPDQAHGCLAEYVVMPSRCCHRLPDSMTLVAGALVEPFSIGLYSQRLAGDVAGKTAAVLGCGPIGLTVLMALRAAGAGGVYMTDIRDYRARLAGQMGAKWTGNPQKQDVVAAMRRAEPLGIDLAFECAGEQETVDQCLEVLAPGGLLLLVGIPELDRLSFEMDNMRRKELRVQNVRRQNDCVLPAIEMIASGQAGVEAMVTHHFSIDQAPEACDVVANYRDNVMKAIIHVSKSP